MQQFNPNPLSQSNNPINKLSQAKLEQLEILADYMNGTSDPADKKRISDRIDSILGINRPTENDLFNQGGNA